VPINARELFLIIRAKDEASRVLRGLSASMLATGAAADKASREAHARATHMLQTGSALASVGIGATLAGGAIEAALFGAARSAIEYNRQAALTATQTDGVSDALTKVSEIGKRVGKDIGVPFEQLQESLYDIFSSMDVSVPQSEILLRGFAKAAVAGQTDMQTAGRATIAIMNAFDVPVKNMNKVLDFQFRLVQKGVGTYEEFARTIGRALPSTVRAGQNIDTLGGSLAFLTRNGLSAAMAATSTARAMDAISHPGSVKNMEKLGINVKKANGEFRPMTNIMKQMQAAFDDMTAPQRAKALYELFKGSGGTIQARRFFDSVLKDRAALKEWAGYVGDMSEGAGVLERKYGAMADTLAVKAEKLNNRWQIVKISIGEQLMPVIERLIEWTGKLIDWWNKLDKQTRENIVTWTAITGAGLIVFGILTTLAGGFIMLLGAMKLAGISASVFFTNFGLIGALLTTVAVAWKTNSDGAMMLAGALTGLLIARQLQGLFTGLSGAMGNARAATQLYSEAVRNGQSRTSAFRDLVGTGMQGAARGFRGALTGLMNFMGGPWGIALVAGGILLGNYMQKQRQSAARVDEHTEALKAQEGQLGKTNREIAFNALYSSGAIQAAQRLGISTKTVVDAALGNYRAQQQMNSALKESNTSFRRGSELLPAWAQGLSRAEKDNNTLRKAVGGSNAEVAKARDKWIAYKEAMGDAGGQAEETGRAIGAGLARGIANSSGMAIEQARQTVNRVNAIMRQTAQVESPSKVTEYIGRMLGEGLVKGLMGSLAKVEQAAASLIDKIRAAYEKADKEVDKGLIKIINTHEKRLSQLGKKLDEKRQLFSQVYNQVTSMGSLAGLGERDVLDAEGNVVGTQVTTSSIWEDLQAKLTQAREFANNIQTLQKMGLNDTMIAGMVEAGAEAAGAQAAALAQGGTATIAEMNKIQEQLNQVAQRTAKTGSESMYAAGKAAAQGIRRGFRSQEQEILDEMERIARKMVRKLEKELGISSPAKAFMPIGAMSAKGVIAGWERTIPEFQSRINAGVSSMGTGTSTTGTNSNQTTKVVLVTVDGRVLAEVVDNQHQLDSRRNGR
jgi:TP901 family phage tail tape measure protein